ncbi:MAG: hypothetical protein AAFU65_04375, partial [Pseudomonadota bacterium]
MSTRFVPRRGWLVAALVLLAACSGPKTDIRHPDTRLLEASVRDAIAEVRTRFDQAVAAGTVEASDYQALGEVYLAHHLN